MEAFIRNLPQIVPEAWCRECRICCRFPGTEGVQAPVWSALEVDLAKRAGAEDSWFLRQAGSPSVSPHLRACEGGGYRCPAFEPQTNRCTIHSVKPLDCRLYPFALTRNAAGDRVTLAMDTKCPFIQAHQTSPELASYAMRLVEYLDRPVGQAYLEQNPQIVGPSWPEYLSVASLPSATRTLQGEKPALPPHPALRLLQSAEWKLVREGLSRREHTSSMYTLAGLLGWSDLIRMSWVARSDALALFAEQGGGLFMPIPPLAARLTPEIVRWCQGLLTQVNSGNGVSRIEGMEAQDLPLFEQMGFSIRPTEGPEYFYRTEDLAHLRGDRYRSQRWAVNRFKKSGPYRYRPFEEADLVPSLQLYTSWAIHRQQASQDPLERRLVRDGLFFHRRLMLGREPLGLLGRVIEVSGQVRAYTFGAPVSEATFCLFLEIADRSLPGLAQALFWEFSRELEGRYRWVNAMGDAGLPRLRRVKESYRPARLDPTWVATWS